MTTSKQGREIIDIPDNEDVVESEYTQVEFRLTQ